MKNNYFLILFAEKNIVSATSDMRKYISQKMLVLCLSCVSHVFLSVPLLVPCCSGSVVPAIVNLCFLKNNYFLILFAEKNIVSATSDMRKYIFPKNARSGSFSCFSCFFSRFPFSCHVVPFPLFRPSLTCVYEKTTMS